MESEAGSTPVPGGYVHLARKLLESPVWVRPHHYLRLWLYFLMKARWKPEPEIRGGVLIRRGQLLKSMRVIAEENEWEDNQRLRRLSTSTVKRALAWFEDQEMIHTQRTDLGTLITVRNFNTYQDSSVYRVDLGTDLGTPGEHLRNNKKKEEEGEEAAEPPPISPPSAAVEALDEFCRIVGTPFELKSITPGEWLSRMAEEFPGIDLASRIHRAAEWWDSALATGQRKKCKAPSRALRVFLRERNQSGPPNTTGKGDSGPGSDRGSDGDPGRLDRFEEWSDEA